MRARDIMTSDPGFVLPGDSLQESARKMQELDVGLIPVVEDPDSLRLAGVITDRDIAVRHIARGCEGCTVEDHMSADGMATVEPNQDADVVMEAMKTHRVRRIPVVEDGRLVGIVAQADLATRLDNDRAEEVEKVVETISR